MVRRPSTPTRQQPRPQQLGKSRHNSQDPAQTQRNKAGGLRPVTSIPLRDEFAQWLQQCGVLKVSFLALARNQSLSVSKRFTHFSSSPELKGTGDDRTHLLLMYRWGTSSTGRSPDPVGHNVPKETQTGCRAGQDVIGYIQPGDRAVSL